MHYTFSISLISEALRELAEKKFYQLLSALDKSLPAKSKKIKRAFVATKKNESDDVAYKNVGAS